MGAVAACFAPLGVDINHDGYMFMPAMDILDGKFPYRDTFIMHGPFSTLFHAGCLKVFGETVLVLRYATVVMYALAAGGFYLVWRRILPDFFAFLAVIIWITLMPVWNPVLVPWSSVNMLPMLCGVLLCGMEAISRKSEKLIFWTAVFTILCWGFREPSGIFIFLSVTFFLVFSSWNGFLNRREAIRFTGIYVGTWCVFFAFWAAFLAWNHALGDWIIQTKMIGKAVFFHDSTTFQTFEALYRCVLCSVRTLAEPGPLWGLISLICLIYICRMFLPDKPVLENASQPIHDNRVCVSFLAVVSLACCSQYFPLCNAPHCAWGASPAFGLLVYAAWDVFGRRKQVAVYVACVFLLGFLLFEPAFSNRVVKGVRRAVAGYRDPVLETPSILAGLRSSRPVDISLAEFEAEVGRYLSTHPDTSVFAVVHQPLYWYTLPRQEYPHPMYINVDLCVDRLYPGYSARLSEHIRENQPLLLIDDVLLENHAEVLQNYEVIFERPAPPKGFTERVLLMAPVEK